jgi:signal transduction histidine kinase
MLASRTRSSSPAYLLSALGASAIVAGIAGGIALPRPLVAEERLGSAIEVRSLDFDRATEEVPVELLGIVIFSDPPSTAFIQDETAGTFFRLGGRPAPRPGDLVRVRGVSFPGLYLPGIEGSEFEVLGHEGLPEGKPADYDDLASGRYHYERVRVEGVVRSLRPDGESASVVRIATGSRILEARIEAALPDEDRLSDAFVAVSGLAAGRINLRRQLVEPYLRCQDWGEIAVIRPPQPLDRVRRPSPEEIMAFDVRGLDSHRVRIAGVVLANPPGPELFLRLDENAIGVRLTEPQSSPFGEALVAGELVEIVGFPEMGRFSATLSDAILVERHPGEAPPEARAASWSEVFAGARDGDLVTLSGTVGDAYRDERGYVLSLRQDQRSIQVRSPAALDWVAAGSLVEVDGICRVEMVRGEQYRSEPESVSMTVSGPEGIRVLRAARWWTAGRLVWALVLSGVSCILAGLWIVLLRRQVAVQTETLRGTIENEAALQERQRLAREFHDTLEQDLAGLALRLDAATTRDADPKLREFLEGSRRLVSRIQSETRNLVADLRASQRDAADLNESLQQLAAEAVPGVGPAILVDLAPLPPLPSRDAHHLRMMAREAVANATKHAAATRIAIESAFSEDRLLLRIADDGQGFDADTETRGRPGHFGCMGMRERARRIGAEVSWESGPEGTLVELRYPCGPAKLSPPTLPER